MAPHWTTRYIGLKYDPHGFDCAHLCERVAREVFGRVLDLPKDRPADGGARAMSAQISAHRAAHLARTETPRDGDCVLMVGAGYLDHIGMFAAIGGEGWVLHNSIRARATCLHRVRELGTVGLALEGYYTWA